MIRQAVRHIAWAVLGLSLVAWGASYKRVRVPLPGQGGLLFDGGGVYRSPDPTTPTTLVRSGTVVNANRIIIRAGLVLPLWVPCMAAAITLWLVWRVGWERRRAALAGCCPACRYDLTGIDGVCPECGRQPC